MNVPTVLRSIQARSVQFDELHEQCGLKVHVLFLRQDSYGCDVYDAGRAAVLLLYYRCCWEDDRCDCTAVCCSHTAWCEVYIY